MVILRTINLSKIYHRGQHEIWALKNINLEVTQGEILCIWGRSGSGKTTLLNMMGALDKPSLGKAFFLETDLSFAKENELSMLRRSKIGFVFQQYNLIPYLTALENVALPLKYAGAPKKIMLKRTVEALEMVGLSARADFYWAELSGGEAQRVAIARALVGNPEIILADEPTGEVDTQTSNELALLINNLNRQTGKTFVIVTHDTLLAQVSSRTLVLKDGQIT